MLPAACLLDGLDAPHAGGAVEVDEAAGSVAGGGFDDEVTVQEDRLDLREQVVVAVKVLPAELDEGDLLYMPTTLPAISIGKAQEILQQTDRLIATVPEVQRVFGKVGRAETATDPAPLTMVETTIQLKPREEWRPGMTTDNLKRELDSLVKLPGITNAWVMPIKTRIDMLATGIKTPVGIKIGGPDLVELERKGFGRGFAYFDLYRRRVKVARLAVPLLSLAAIRGQADDLAIRQVKVFVAIEESLREVGAWRNIYQACQGEALDVAVENNRIAGLPVLHVKTKDELGVGGIVDQETRLLFVMRCQQQQ